MAVGTGLADRVRETSGTAGTGTFTLDGAVSGYRTFLTAFSTGTPCYYVIQGGTDWEVGIGIITSPNQLSRDTVLQSSNSGALVNFAAGPKDVFGSRVEGSTESGLFIAGEAISARDALYMELRSGARTIGRVYKASALNNSTSVQAVFVGLAVGAALIGKAVSARHFGVMGGFSSLTPGAPQYLSNTSGAITETAPANARVVATAVNATEVFINEQPLRRPLVADDNTGNNLGVIGHGMYGNARSGSSGSILKGNSFDYIDLMSLIGNASSRGTASPAAASYGVVGSSAKGFFCGGASGTTSITLETAIAMFDRYVASGNAVNTGDLTQARSGIAGVNGANYGFLCGGLASTGVSNVIDLLTFSTFTNATTDAGDLLIARKGAAGCGTASAGFIAGGENSGYLSMIDKLDLTTATQNSTDRGDLSSRRAYAAGLSGVEPLVAGGFDGEYLGQIEQIDSLTYSTLALDRGELTMPRSNLGAASVAAQGVFAGGTNGVETTLIETIDPNFLVLNVSNRGDLSYGRSGCGGL